MKTAVVTDAQLPLAGLRVLVTRPAHQAAAWQQLLLSEGAAVVSVPLLDIVPFTAESGAPWHALRSRIQDLDYYRHLIFVSQNAVRLGMERVLEYWPQLPLRLQFYAVGAATAAALRDYDVNVSEAGEGMNSEALLQLAGLQQVDQQRILIFRGAGGRPTLGQELADRGARVDYCELYERRLPAAATTKLALLAESGSDLIVSVHSGETLQNLRRLISELANNGILNPLEWLQRPLLVPGERVAQLAAESGFRQVIVANNASDRSMLDALLEWRRNAE